MYSRTLSSPDSPPPPLKSLSKKDLSCSDTLNLLPSLFLHPFFTVYRIIQTVNSVFLGLAHRRHLHPRRPHHAPRGRHAPQRFPLGAPQVSARYGSGSGRSSALRVVAPVESRVFPEKFLENRGITTRTRIGDSMIFS